MITVILAWIGGAALGAGLILVYKATHRPRGVGRFYLSDEPFEVGLTRVTSSGRRDSTRTLTLTMTGPGCYAEVEIGDGGELLRDLYEARSWLYEEVLSKMRRRQK